MAGGAGPFPYSSEYGKGGSERSRGGGTEYGSFPFSSSPQPGGFVGRFGPSSGGSGGSAPSSGGIPEPKPPPIPPPQYTPSTSSYPSPPHPSGTPPRHTGIPPPPYGLSSDDPAYRSHQYRDPKGGVHRYETLQDRLFNVIGGFFVKVWRTSDTVVRADLIRPYNPKQARVEGREDSSEGHDLGQRRRKRMRGVGWEPSDGYLGGMIQGLDRGLYGNGAQLKLMQIWKFPDQTTGQPKLPGNLNFGFGVNFDLDSTRFQLKTRLRSDHVVLRMFPRPDIEFRGKWRIGNSRIGVDVRYRVPVRASLTRYLDSPDQAGYLSVRLFNAEGTGFNLSPDGGLEFDEQVVRLGDHTKFRVAAKVSFPRYFPWDEDDDPLLVEFRRLGLKTVLK